MTASPTTFKRAVAFARRRVFPLGALTVVVLTAVWPGRAEAQTGLAAAVSIRITSPLGRTGAQGRIRMVAQVIAPSAGALGPVRFFMNGMLLGEDADGAPYAIDWVDDNPFEQCELRVEVTDDRGRVYSDIVVLEPYEIVEESEVTSVLIEAAVVNAAGRYIAGLAPNDFMVTEDEIPQKLDLAQQVVLPTAFALLVDSSQSMSRRMDFVRLAAGRLAERIRRDDRVFVVPFATGPQTVTGPTNDRATIAEALNSINASGGTAILDSLSDTAKLLESVEGARRVIVLITDGYDENSRNSIEDTLATVGTAHASVFVVAIGGVAGISLKGERFLRELAEQTGGRAFFPPREDSLATVYEVLLEDIENRYLLTYTPANQIADGRFRRLNVRVEGEGLTVQARNGYFAPKPPPVRPSIEFTVTDADLRYVDVSADDLIVIEDGVEQEIASFQEAISPVSIVLALDASGSMRRAAEAVVSAAHRFVDALRPEDALAVVLFADRSMFAQDLSTNRTASQQAVDEYQAVGGTALYDAIVDSLGRLGRVDGRRAVVVLTDGRDENNPGTGPGSLATIEDVLEAQRTTGALIFGIGLGPNVDRATLQILADRSTARAYFPQDVDTLAADYARIVEDLRRRFVLTYVSTNPARNGTWRTVEIKTRAPNLIVRGAGGFFAPAR